MSTSDPDPARAPRAPETPPAAPPPTRRFARGSGQPVDGYDTTSPVAAANAPAPISQQEGDVWSHEVGTRRFEPSQTKGEYPVDASIVKVAEPRPPRIGPSVPTRAFEQTVPPPSVVASASASSFVTDALADLSAEDEQRTPPPPRRIPGTPSMPPPGSPKH
jgi:hypothetical protein